MEHRAGGYFKAARELARSDSAGGLVDFLAMFPVPLSMRGLTSEQDQLRLCQKLYEEPDDQTALGIFLDGDAGGIGLAELIDGGHYGWQTATKLHEQRVKGASILLPSPGSIAKPAYDLGMIYADGGRQPLNDPARIAQHAALHCQVIALDFAIADVTAHAASFMYQRGYKWSTAHPGPSPLAQKISREQLSNLDRMAAKLGRR